MTIMNVFVFGNPDLEFDALPLRLLPRLREIFPTCEFACLDPNEDWDVPDHMVIIDTVINISEPKIFFDLSAFVSAPRISCHDFDAYANLLLLKKLGKLDQTTILGLPPTFAESDALTWTVQELKGIL